MSHYTQRDASGRVISLLHDTNEAPTYESHSPYSSTRSAHSTYSQSRKGNTSYPDTPDLLRSDSYDSQASGHESPLTPNSAYQEPLFSNVMPSENGAFPSRIAPKDAPAHLYNGEVQTLPPISFFHKVAGTLEPTAATAPESSRRRSSNPYAIAGATSSSSSLEEFHYRPSTDSHECQRRPPVLPEPALHHSVETHDDSPYHEQPLIEHRQVATKHEDEKPDSGRKGSKNKPGSQKRYPCKDPTCDRTFTTSGHASRHAKIHEGLKPIPCTHDGCPKRFTRQDNMKQHLETHRREKSRASAKQARRPSLATRRQSASSRGSVSRFSTPRDTPPLLSPALQSVPMLSPALSESWTRPTVTSRTPSGLDALAMVAATEQEEAQRQVDHFHYWQHAQPVQRS